jgi:5-methyltetrahydropteroyltriglutamate--homocysteine methyltransferase
VQPALEMTKWFDTNYHYLVPELARETSFSANAQNLLNDIQKLAALGVEPQHIKPVLIGPLTYLWLAKAHGDDTNTLENKLDLLPQLLSTYVEILQYVKATGVEWVQIDEPILALDLPESWLAAYDFAYGRLHTAGLKVLLATYFADVSEHAVRLVQLPVQGFHIDLVRAPQQAATWLKHLPANAVLSVGVIDGRNVWRNDLSRTYDSSKPLHEALGARLWLSHSCSLLHVPVSLSAEQKMDAQIKDWLAFAHEKIDELHTLKMALNDGVKNFASADTSIKSRQTSSRVVSDLVRHRLAAVTTDMTIRKSPFKVRIKKQRTALSLPLFPTTTIGSFPQTMQIRQIRAAHKLGDIGALEYLNQIRAEIKTVVREQEALGLDVLVHGEAERNDMVEYFGEQLWGYVFSTHGWVQSYGSRCVKPPIIYGDVYRPEAMTVEFTRYAQSLTDKPMKGMLTGPITMLQWSFVRDDQARELTALQLALAIRDEVKDLEAAGIKVIQIDEPALREGLPLKRRDWAVYLEWAVRAFKLASTGVADDTQIHTHMCYSEFNDILPSIAALDADVITIETSRSNMKLLKGFGDFNYPNDIGPGVYDIHSARVPNAQAMVYLLEKAAQVIPAEQLWVNPDCGLKTRGWEETREALSHMIAAAREMRLRSRVVDKAYTV